MTEETGGNSPNLDAAQTRLLRYLGISPDLVSSLRTAQATFPEIGTPHASLSAGVAEAVKARRQLSARMLAFADSLLQGVQEDSAEDAETDARMATARYYYSINHLLRAAFMAVEFYDCAQDSGGHSQLFRSISQLALTDRKLMAKMEMIESLGDAIRSARVHAWPQYKRRANDDIRQMLEGALKTEPYLSEADRAQYLRGWLNKVQSEAQGAGNKAAKDAVERFLRDLHTRRTMADYDPLAVTDRPLSKMGLADGSQEAEAAVDFVAEAKALSSIAHSFSEHIGAYIDETIPTRPYPSEPIGG